MNGPSPNEMRILLKIFKDFNNYHNANKLSKELGLSSMGVLKIVKKLEKQNLIEYDLVGKAKIYHINFKNNYSKEYISFLLRKEAEENNPRIKRWITELRKLKQELTIGILFGSVLINDNHKDVDALVVLKQSQVKKFNKKINEMNQINVKRIHIIKQSSKDLKKNLIKKDKIIINALKEGIVWQGHDNLIEVVESVSR